MVRYAEKYMDFILGLVLVVFFWGVCAFFFNGLGKVTSLEHHPNSGGLQTLDQT